MTGPCQRPECGGEVHTDGWGNPIQCPARRCPRCDCPDGHTQCDHCKVCPHAEPDLAARLDFARQYARAQRDYWQRRLDELDRKADAFTEKEAP
ncbi:hypothetical protein [Streptomyces mirabilis]|uniref:hypothetical protein n=1 Tax=Streptomyces mirabilis TaxID=68239 RepID=UPI00340CA5CF